MLDHPSGSPDESAREPDEGVPGESRTERPATPAEIAEQGERLDRYVSELMAAFPPAPSKERGEE